MNTSTARQTINVLSVLVLFLWVSNIIVYFPVFPTLASVDEGFVMLSNKAMCLAITKDVILTIFGIAGSIFMINKKKIGRYITLYIAIVMISIKLFEIIANRDNLVIWLITIYTARVLPSNTFRTIHLDLFAPIIYILCAILLLNKDISRQFD